MNMKILPIIAILAVILISGCLDSTGQVTQTENVDNCSTTGAITEELNDKSAPTCTVSCRTCEKLNSIVCVCESITPCCGNYVCEPEETHTSCPSDCEEKESTRSPNENKFTISILSEKIKYPPQSLDIHGDMAAWADLETGVYVKNIVSNDLFHVSDSPLDRNVMVYGEYVAYEAVDKMGSVNIALAKIGDGDRTLITCDNAPKSLLNFDNNIVIFTAPGGYYYTDIRNITRSCDSDREVTIKNSGNNPYKIKNIVTLQPGETATIPAHEIGYTPIYDPYTKVNLDSHLKIVEDSQPMQITLLYTSAADCPYLEGHGGKGQYVPLILANGSILCVDFTNRDFNDYHFDEKRNQVFYTLWNENKPEVRIFAKPVGGEKLFEINNKNSISDVNKISRHVYYECYETGYRGICIVYRQFLAVYHFGSDILVVFPGDKLRLHEHGPSEIVEVGYYFSDPPTDTPSTGDAFVWASRANLSISEISECSIYTENDYVALCESRFSIYVFRMK
jgi:hypothetical protein